MGKFNIDDYKNTFDFQNMEKEFPFTGNLPYYQETDDNTADRLIQEILSGKINTLTFYLNDKIIIVDLSNPVEII